MIITLTRASHGFSLLELIAVILIIAILTAVGYPMYRSHVLKTRRADAKSALAQLAQSQETYYTDNNSSYASTFTNLKGLDGFNEVQETTLRSNEGYYLITLSGGGSAFTLTAVPTTEGGQTDDIDCPQLTINSVGEKLPEGCW